jgi:uncharacterized protein YqeY
MLRDRINDAVKDAMKARDAARVSALRMITSALKDREIAARTEPGGGGPLSDEQIFQVLQKMIKQREDSAAQYIAGKRPELAAKEEAEIAVCREYLPRAMDASEVEAAVKAAVVETGASSLKDMGKVMAALKAKHAGRMDFGKANAVVKGMLGAG